ncbi:MAG: hypothetical protein EBZ69_07235 [Alphaproteobacteria bacterium]|nr:hypothetical protein [Alphaproteobacteria bacterium]
MTIATKNGAIIVKDGKLAENCGCCGEWYCDQQYGACCNGTQCENKYKCDCAGTSTFKNGVPCGGSACYCVFPTLAPLPGATTGRLPVYCTISDGARTFSGNYLPAYPFDGGNLSALDAYGNEYQGASTNEPAGFFVGGIEKFFVRSQWERYLDYPALSQLPFGTKQPKCCGDSPDNVAKVQCSLFCDGKSGSWTLEWYVELVCRLWGTAIEGNQTYLKPGSLYFGANGSISISAASNGLPQAGTYRFFDNTANYLTNNTPCRGYITDASLTISHS